MPLEYLRDPRRIYEESFRTVARETDLTRFPESLRPVVIRLVHACGMPEIAPDLRWHLDCAGAAHAALAGGAPVIADCEMVAHGITRARLPAANEVLCTLNDARVPDLARAKATTRSAAAVDLWRPRLDGAVVAIGNAPTALFRLLELVLDGAPRPAAVFAFPVGFVGAAESKQALLDLTPDVAFLTLPGRRGGSALAAAAVNAVARRELV